MCCKQKTYGLAKPFRCNTYKKHGWGYPQLSHSSPLSPIFSTLFQVPYPASRLFATLTKTPGVWGYSSHFGTWRPEDVASVRSQREFPVRGHGGFGTKTV